MYLLDTNAVIAVQKNVLNVLRRVRVATENEIVVSSIVLHELYFGAFKSDRIERNIAELSKLRFAVLDYTVEDARVAGVIRADLRRKGTPIGPYDMLIAGQARARDMTLVTRNVREFARVDGLRVEGWEA